MEKDLQARLREITDEVSKHYKAMPKLIELQSEAKKAFDERIESLLQANDLVKRIKFPKVSINWRYLVSAPFIYSMIFPSIIFHISIEIYHQICFRLYGIPLVKSKEYFVHDRQLLSMLNIWEKINCIYCSYVNNLIRYSSEIGGRTERYWCPIKYYRRIKNSHSQYSKFVEGDDPQKMREEWEELRDFSDLKIS